MSRKHNWEKIESEQAEKEKRQSEERERAIAELSRAIERLVSDKEQPGEGILALARELAAQWKSKKRPLFQGLLENNRLALLVALVVALREDHELVARIRSYFPNKLENLVSASGDAELRAFVESITLPEPAPKRKYEWKRRKWHRSFFNSIEYQFGGAAEAERRESSLLPLGNSPYEPTCLDEIFAGETVNMQRLEDLFFAIHRHRLSEALQGVQKRRYDYRAVAKIMEALLSEKPRKKRKRRGRSLRNPWLDDLDDPSRRTRVLNAIEARIKGITTLLLSIALEEAELSNLTDKELALVRTVFEHFRGYAEWQKDVADPFLAVVHRHLRQFG